MSNRDLNGRLLHTQQVVMGVEFSENRVSSEMWAEQFRFCDVSRRRDTSEMGPWEVQRPHRLCWGSWPRPSSGDHHAFQRPLEPPGSPHCFSVEHLHVASLVLCGLCGPDHCFSGLLKDGWVVWVLKKSAGRLGFWPQSLRTLYSLGEAGGCAVRARREHRGLRPGSLRPSPR